jgi:predicted RNA-binding Zn ribbon-like protein
MSISNPEISPPRFQRIGGELCLDFANTVQGSRTLPHLSREMLNSYADLVEWGRAVLGLTKAQAKELLKAAQRRPQEAAATLKRAIVLRAAVYNLFSTMAAELRLPEEDLRTLNSFMVPAYAQLRLIDRGGANGCEWRWVDEPVPLDQVILRAAISAVYLLFSADLKRVRQCNAENCGRLFVDRTKNLSRRWCNMRECGNRAKVHRYRQRERERKLIDNGAEIGSDS